MPIDDLIYDVGLHIGQDTEFYLKKGYRVVAFEANPPLIADARARFADAIAAGRLTIVEGAIADGDMDEPITFYDHDNPSWGTVDPAMVERNLKQGAKVSKLTVRKVDFAEALRTQGAPHFIKIDIEGMDDLCLHGLAKTDARPDYIAIESDKVDFGKLEAQFDLLESLGYDSFQVVQQAWMSRRRLDPGRSRSGEPVSHHFIEGASGLFGAEMPDAWVSRAEAVDRYRRIFRMYRLFGDRSWGARLPQGPRLIRGLSRLVGTPLPGWYDTHARHSRLKR